LLVEAITHARAHLRHHAGVGATAAAEAHAATAEQPAATLLALRALLRLCLRHALGLALLHLLQRLVEGRLLFGSQAQAVGQRLQVLAHARTTTAARAAMRRAFRLHLGQRRTFRRLEAQRRVAQLEHAFALADFDLGVDG